ncbi:hypothetical protein ACQ86G_30220 [Roseateles chitinivorans]|uniref:hypothetical protein n=1 Tax=Roseateles chitinivorans TaxID=2917965 RepID=UPI003D67B901
MDYHLSVNEALARLPELEGRDIRIEGVLSFDFEDVCVSHFPADERADGYRSSIWLWVGTGSLGFDREACRRLSGRRVVVEGSLSAATPTMGCGHMGLWPAELLVRTLNRA